MAGPVNVLRSDVYSFFSESLSGLSTISAFNQTDRFRTAFEQRLNNETRAYFLSISNQRWLALRVDCLTACLTGIVGLVCVIRKDSFNPSEVGLTLSAVVSASSACPWLVRNLLRIDTDFDSCVLSSLRT